MEAQTHKIYFKNLDGLRFLAFLSVFVSHAFDFLGYKPSSVKGQTLIEHLFLHGDLGVSFFFVLSGFLITFLLQHEKKEFNTISIPGFYMRRVLRIWPVYFMTVFFGFFVIPYFFQNTATSFHPFNINTPAQRLPWYLCFAANFDIIANGPGFLIISVLWSVSVEEQFYLVWPLLNKLTKPKGMILAISAILIFSFYFRWHIYLNSYEVKYNTFSVMNDLAIGSLSALMCFYSQKFRQFFEGLKKPSIAFVYILLLLLVPLRLLVFTLPQNAVHFFVALEPVLFSVLFAFVIIEQNYSLNSIFKIGNLKPLNYLGKISYGLYSYHMICLFFTGLFFRFFLQDLIAASLPLFFVQFATAIALSIGISWLSYHYIEERFLSLKNRFVQH